MSTLSFDGLWMVTHSLPSSLPAGFWSKACIITPEEAVKAVEVANAMPVKRSIKAIPNNSPWFLVIVIEIFTLCVKNASHEKIEKLLYACVTPVTIVLLKVNCVTAS
jgi:hypothetical protein